MIRHKGSALNLPGKGGFGVPNFYFPVLYDTSFGPCRAREKLDNKLRGCRRRMMSRMKMAEDTAKLYIIFPVEVLL